MATFTPVVEVYTMGNHTIIAEFSV